MTMNYEEMTKEELIQKIKSLEAELKKSKDSLENWYESWKKEEKKVDALRSIIFGALNLLEQ